MNDTYKEAFWKLFHINAEIMLALTANSDNSEGRRKYDGFIKHKSEQIDAIMLDLPKEPNGQGTCSD